MGLVGLLKLSLKGRCQALAKMYNGDQIGIAEIIKAPGHDDDE